MWSRPSFAYDRRPVPAQRTGAGARTVPAYSPDARPWLAPWIARTPLAAGATVGARRRRHRDRAGPAHRRHRPGALRRVVRAAPRGGIRARLTDGPRVTLAWSPLGRAWRGRPGNPRVGAVRVQKVCRGVRGHPDHPRGERRLRRTRLDPLLRQSCRERPVLTGSFLGPAAWVAAAGPCRGPTLCPSCTRHTRQERPRSAWT